MARGIITLRPAPAAELCSKVGDTGYAEIAFLQCRRYITLLRQAIGPEPEGARLRVRRSDSDFDPYIDVVVEYDDQNAVAADYALRCERDAPTRWRETSGAPAESARWRSSRPEGPEPAGSESAAGAKDARRATLQRD
jgi:hypothetical protein